MSRAGGCLCGAVRFRAAEAGNFGVCHCSQCRHWAGAALFAAVVPEAAMAVEDGGGALRTFRSSSWASRSFCTRCGSVLWYRHDRGVDGAGDYEVAIGAFDDGNGFRLEREIYADLKPDSWALAGDHLRMDTAATLARYGLESEGA